MHNIVLFDLLDPSPSLLGHLNHFLSSLASVSASGCKGKDGETFESRKNIVDHVVRSSYGTYWKSGGKNPFRFEFIPFYSQVVANVIRMAIFYVRQMFYIQ